MGSPALAKFFTRASEGTLVTDFWSPYEGVICTDKQKCWPHVLRVVDEAHADHSERKSFSRGLVGVYRDTKKLHPQRAQLAAAAYDMSEARLETRIGKLANENWEHPDANRLAKRLIKHGNGLFTFL